MGTAGANFVTPILGRSTNFTGSVQSLSSVAFCRRVSAYTAPDRCMCKSPPFGIRSKNARRAAGLSWMASSSWAVRTSGIRAGCATAVQVVRQRARIQHRQAAENMEHLRLNFPRVGRPRIRARRQFGIFLSITCAGIGELARCTASGILWKSREGSEFSAAAAGTLLCVAFWCTPRV